MISFETIDDCCQIAMYFLIRAVPWIIIGIAIGYFVARVAL